MAGTHHRHHIQGETGPDLAACTLDSDATALSDDGSGCASGSCSGNGGHNGYGGHDGCVELDHRDW
jgi:hypothetical protein